MMSYPAMTSLADSWSAVSVTVLWYFKILFAQHILHLVHKSNYFHNVIHTLKYQSKNKSYVGFVIANIVTSGVTSDKISTKTHGLGTLGKLYIGPRASCLAFKTVVL